jgi:cytidylate kinase
MPQTLLVIITGPACTGKTTLGNRLSSECDLPFFYKDGFKEMMYDVVMERSGVEGITLDMTRMLGKMSIHCLNIVIEAMLARGRSLIVEANFDSALYTPFVLELQQKHEFHLVQVQLKCDGAILLQRFIQREQMDRHPGHQGLTYLEATKPTLLSGEQAPLQVAGDLLVFDTTDIADVDYQPLLALLKRLTADGLS